MYALYLRARVYVSGGGGAARELKCLHWISYENYVCNISKIMLNVLNNTNSATCC